MSDDFDLDLGSNHKLSFFGWHPDDLEGNRARYGVPLPNVPRAGALVIHLAPDGHECYGAIHFDLPEIRQWFPESKIWKVLSWEPLTVEPSLLCRACGDHGFIRQGRWESCG